MASAWIYQDDKQIKKHGAAKASWYVGWIDPAGKRKCKSCGPGALGKANAEKLRKKTEAELLTGTYQAAGKMTWEDFRQEYEAKVAEGMDARNREETRHALDQFERLVHPQRMLAITTRTVADFVAKRRVERGQKPGSTVSPATVNKELRHLRGVLRKAFRWDYLAKAPDFDFLKEAKKLPTYVTPDHFVAIYAACDTARWPEAQPFTQGDWWRGLIVMAYMTGWRIGALMALRWQDVDLDAGTGLTRAADNKGKRDQKTPLHPLVVEHLRKLVSFSPTVFPWPYRMRSLFPEFAKVQQAAGVVPDGDKGHYGFHDLRRAFATMNADKLTPDALQFLMQHKDYKTTQGYISMARQLTPAVASLYVPKLPKVETA
jgi:integrase